MSHRIDTEHVTVDRHEEVKETVEASGETVPTTTPEEFRHERREHVMHDVGAERHQQLVRVSQVLWFLFGIIGGLIALRILLAAIGANPSNAFANFVYTITAPFVAPFSTLVTNPSFDGIVLEVTSIIALIVYALITWAIVRLLWLVFVQPSARSVSVAEREKVGRTETGRIVHTQTGVYRR